MEPTGNGNANPILSLSREQQEYLLSLVEQDVPLRQWVAAVDQAVSEANNGQQAAPGGND